MPILPRRELPREPLARADHAIACVTPVGRRGAPTGGLATVTVPAAAEVAPAALEAAPIVAHAALAAHAGPIPAPVDPIPARAGPIAIPAGPIPARAGPSAPVAVPAGPTAAEVARLSAVITRQRRELDLLGSQLRARAVVDLARGMLMEQFGCTPAQAQRQLARLAGESHVSVTELAAQITHQRAPAAAPDPAL